MEDESSSCTDVTSSSIEEDENEEDEPSTEPLDVLWCSGDSPDTPQHNFMGVWNLNQRGPRPAYEHNATDGTPVYLYFVENSAAGPCPRWVIGPEPGGSGANGWAFSDSSAWRPEDIVEPWRWWVKETSQWEEARLAFSAKGAAIGRDHSYDDDAALTPGEDGASGAAEGAADGGGARKKKAAKKKGGKGGGGAKAKKGGEGKPKAAAKPKAAKA